MQAISSVQIIACDGIAMEPANYSLFAIPAYLVIAQVPHAFSVALITRNNNNKWDLTSPRSTGNRSKTEASVPKHVYRKFERCRAAHDNMFENMAVSAAAALLPFSWVERLIYSD